MTHPQLFLLTVTAAALAVSVFSLVRSIQTGRMFLRMFGTVTRKSHPEIFRRNIYLMGMSVVVFAGLLIWIIWRPGTLG